MVNDFNALAEKLLRVAAHAGADDADVLLVDGQSVGFEFIHFKRISGMF